MEIIQNIIDIMKNKGITPAQMERDIKIKQSTFISWKKGSQPAADKLQKIIQYLEVTPNEIFGYSDIIDLNENEKEMLNLFKQLPEREQIKFIARLEDKIHDLKISKEESNEIKNN